MSRTRGESLTNAQKLVVTTKLVRKQSRQSFTLSKTVAILSSYALCFLNKNIAAVLGIFSPEAHEFTEQSQMTFNGMSVSTLKI